MSDLRVLLVEDHLPMQAAMAALLSRHCLVVGTAGRGDLVVSVAGELLPDVVVLDISLPGRSGLQLLPELRSRHPSMAIVMLTNQDQPIYRNEAAQRGADGYVLKDRAAQELWPAVQNAALVRCVATAWSAKRA